MACYRYRCPQRLKMSDFVLILLLQKEWVGHAPPVKFAPLPVSHPLTDKKLGIFQSP
jgi:hypothetical protein